MLGRASVAVKQCVDSSSKSLRNKVRYSHSLTPNPVPENPTFAKVVEMWGKISPFGKKPEYRLHRIAFIAANLVATTALAKYLAERPVKLSASDIELHQALFDRKEAVQKDFIKRKLTSPLQTGEKPLVLFVLGGPGSGKGTQCAKLVSECGFVHLSAGDLLRAEIQSGSPHGDMISTIIKNGQIVTSEITVGLLKKAMDANPTKSFLIDGFPRNDENNSAFEKTLGSEVDVAGVLFFDCPESVMQKRLLQRGQTSNRTDDNLDSIKKRFKTYVDSTLPVIQYYEKKGKLGKIDADLPVDKVHRRVMEFVKKVVTERYEK